MPRRGSIFVLALALLAAVCAASVPARERATGAARGDPAQLLALGQRYLHGEGVARDLERGVSLLCAAARRGSTRAQYQLGWLYANGRGVARDDALAAAWLRLAAAGGDHHAARLLPLMDERDGVKPALCVTPQRSAPILGGRPRRGEIEAAVRLLAPGYGLDPRLVLAVVAVESDFDVRARSHKGAMGLMQLMPDTARRFQVIDAYEPSENLRGGMSYLAWLLARFAGDVRLSLAAYNAGEGAVERHRGVPPYAETRAYLRRIARLYPHAKHAPDLLATAHSGG